MVRRFEVYLLNVDESPEARDTRPCVIVSPDEMNKHLDSVIIAPVSTVTREYPTRVPFEFLGGMRAVVLDQIQTVAKSRLTKKIGDLDSPERAATVAILQEIFAQ
ncbi:MAG TPA: type II toxin-antitoxin system PemK/MazF family toxin [Pyrinomonadaceae bacterium]|nr:type II toxin-antitoxin system PemK/MazF family toxin [Pyrinomonadaceae bacterium]HNU07422.1 type II toxin-antitoxin system PemK/MazF family toxin [Pyrinomonadaceae bacterium]